MTATKRKYLNNLKNLKEAYNQLKIDNEVMRRQLVSVRNIINEILGDRTLINLAGEPIHVNIDREAYNTIKGIQQEKQNQREQKQPQKCLNCQKLGYYDHGFCFECSKLDHKTKPASELSEQETQEKKTEFNPPKEKVSQFPYNCAKCGVEGDNRDNFKTHNGYLYCLDCLSSDFNIKGGKK